MTLDMSKLKDYIVRCIVGARAAKKARHDAEIKARFRISERGGKIYLLCCGTAVAVINESNNAAMITRQIKAAREAAIDYEQQSTNQTNRDNHGTK